jgi:hypothetical protein
VPLGNDEGAALTHGSTHSVRFGVDLRGVEPKRPQHKGEGRLGRAARWFVRWYRLAERVALSDRTRQTALLTILVTRQYAQKLTRTRLPRIMEIRVVKALQNQ